MKMLNSYHILLTIWSKNNLFSKIIYIISFVLLMASVLIFVLTLINKSNNNEYLDKFEDTKSSLKIIEKFDKLFPGKWTHYLNSDPKISIIQNALELMNFDNLEITNKENTFLVEGQTNSILALMNAIQVLYNEHGFVIQMVEIDQVNDISIFNLSLTY